MLTVVTPLKHFRFRYTDLEKVMFGLDSKLYSHPLQYLPYACALEIEAMVRGEPFSKYLIALANWGISKAEATSTCFNFLCSDGKYAPSYNKHTLARHSLLIRDFIVDFPEANEIDMSQHSVASVRRALEVVDDASSTALTPTVLYALQTLNPPTDLYYLLFDLPKSIEPGFILSIIKGMTREERDGALQCHNLSTQLHLHEDDRPLPDCGKGLVIAYAFPSVCDYIIENEAPALCDSYPSYVFYTLLQHSEDSPRIREMLRSVNFDDDCGVLSYGCRAHLIERILTCATSGTWSGFCTIVALLGVRSPLLGNEAEGRLGPYQLRLKERDIEFSYWQALERRITELYKGDASAVLALFKPYVYWSYDSDLDD